MRKWILAAALAGTAATISTAASAEDYGYCWTRGNGVNLVSPIFTWEDGEGIGMKVESNWKYFAWRQFRAEVSSRGDCSKFSSEVEAQNARSRLLNNIRRPENSKKYRLELVDYIPVSRFGRPATRKANLEATTEKRPNSAERAEPQLPQAAELKAQREAEFQAKLAAHEASVAEYQRRVAEREAEIARQKAQHAAAQDAAARKQAAYEAKMAVHRRQVEEAEAARRRHMECLSWNKEACDDILAGRVVSDTAERQEASTDTDANRCVTTAEVRSNASFQGNTSASVMNGCGKPVDVRICLKRATDWNCGVDSAVAPQQQAVHSSFNATGDVFVDARTTGSSRPFTNPPS